jgi:hypothetical protein
LHFNPELNVERLAGDIPKVAPKTEQFSVLFPILSSSIFGAWQKDKNGCRTLLARRLENFEISGD